MPNLTGFTQQSATAAAATAVVITLPARGAGRSNLLLKAEGSYSGAATAGMLTVEDGAGGTVLYRRYIDRTTGLIDFEGGIQGSPNTAMVITLASGGAGIIGALFVESGVVG